MMARDVLTFNPTPIYDDSLWPSQVLERDPSSSRSTLGRGANKHVHKARHKETLTHQLARIVVINADLV